MRWNKKLVNLVLGGGGVKGIAYIGAFEEAEARNIRWGSIAGVSAGALAGTFLGAGYSAADLKMILSAFDMGKIDMTNITKRVPVVARYMKFSTTHQNYGQVGIDQFLNLMLSCNDKVKAESNVKAGGYRGNILQNIVTFSKEGCLFDGDYLEEWVAKVLAGRGIITFEDLKGGIADKVNPGGYRVRMTAVDINRAKVIILPDDLTFYGINPDRFSVARAIRMSSCVPFVFKPVEIKKKEGGFTRTYHIVDGGMLDGFPFWMIDNSSHIPAVGFILDGGGKKNLFSLDTSLDILKAIVSAVHDTGVPENAQKIKYLAKIDTSKVGFLDFNLGKEEMEYLYAAGREPARLLYNKLEYDMFGLNRPRWIWPPFFNIRNRRLF